MNKTYAWVRSLSYRRATNGWLGGICAGLAQQTGIDVVLIRAVTVLLVIPFTLGSVGLLYLIGWLLLPDRDGAIVLEKIFGDPAPSTPSQASTPPTYVFPTGGSDSRSGSTFRSGNAPTTESSSTMNSPTPPPSPSFDPGNNFNYNPSFNPADVRRTQLPDMPPQRPPRQGPGSTLSLLIGGILLIAAALFLFAAFTDTLGKIASITLSIAAITIICALGAIAAHVRGRNGTWMTALASVCAWGLLVPAIFTYAFIPSSIRYEMLSGDLPVYTSSRVDGASLKNSYDFIIGETSISLPSAKKATANSAYNISGGIGEVTIYVPQGVQATIKPSVGIGEIQWEQLGEGEDEGLYFPDSCDAVFGFSSNPCEKYERSGITVGSGIPVRVNVDLSMGSLYIVEIPTEHAKNAL